MLRSLILAAALTFNASAFAQSNATQQVQLLAPQLVTFSGSSGNFDSLVTGLTTGAAITLVTVGSDGSLQIVTFVAGSALSAPDAARALESARQSLISRGVATPNAQQIAASLMGGTIFTPSGTTLLTGVLTGTSTPPTPIQVRTDAAPLQGTTGAPNLSSTQLQALRNALATGTGVTLTNGSGTQVVFSPTGRMSDFEVNQALQLAATLLAQQGILNPTAAELRAALFGGTVLAANGASVPVQGVLQGRVRNTSESPQLSVSASPLFGTSDTPARATAPSTAPAGGTAIGGAAVAPRGTLPPAGVVRPGAR